MNDPTPKLVITKQQQKKSSSHVFLFKAISHTKSEWNRHLSSLLCCCMQLFLHAELICSMERREIGMGGDEKDLLFLYTHSHFLSIRDVVHSNRQAPGGCAVVCMAPWGAQAGPIQNHV